MNRFTGLVAVTLAAALCFGAYAEPQQVAAELNKDNIAITVDGKLFTCYTFAHSRKYPYFFPVNGPASGKSVTTETSEPYPHHHSLFFGCDKVNGGNYWQDINKRGQILSQGTKILEASGERAVFTDTCLWQQPGKDPVIRDTRTVTIAAPSGTVRLIDFEIALEPLEDVRIEKTNHSLFSARMAPEMSVESGGTIVNADGGKNAEGTHGVVSAWCDYFGMRDGVTEGLAIFQFPGNYGYPCEFFTRDYGFFSPTPMNWVPEGFVEFAKGEIFTLRYRVVVHAGDAKAADIAGLFEAYK